ncbi:TPA: hypothetical protein DEP96_01220 [Candidatus Uhrbacteria bacterium]|nr:hypothetical protein [Candidatus Uhrbacteria bacterium]
MFISLFLSLIGFTSASELSGLSPTQEIEVTMERCRLIQAEQSDIAALGNSNFMLRVPAKMGVIVPHYTGCDSVIVYKMDHGLPVPIVAEVNGQLKSVLVADHFGDKFYIGRTFGEKAITVYGDQYDNAGIPTLPNGPTAVEVKADGVPTTCSSSTAMPGSTSIYITCH